MGARIQMSVNFAVQTGKIGGMSKLAGRDTANMVVVFFEEYGTDESQSEEETVS